MARRGSFGSRPRVAQSLTSTIVSIEREMQQRRDQNIMDAWKNGGEFEGKKPTDESVLKYWTDREANLDPKDPAYETMKDNVMQLQYGIEQSKADLANKQGKLSDAGYAKFYLDWSKKAPKNSEFYRTLQKDAAVLIERTKTDSANKMRKEKADAFDAFVKATSTRDINVGNALRDAFYATAKEANLNPDADGAQIMGLLTARIKSNPAEYKALTDAERAVNPNWDGQVTAGFFAKQMQQATTGYATIADRANKDGYQPQYASATKASQEMAGTAAAAQAWPVEQSYDAAYQALIKVWGDKSSSEIDRNAAASTFADAVGKLTGTPGIDPIIKQRLQADADRAIGKPAGDTVSLAQVLGRTPLDDSTATKVKAAADKQAMKDANPGAYLYAPVDSNGQYDPSGQGGLGIVPTSAVSGEVAQVVVVGTSGKPVIATVPSHAIYAINPQNPSDRQIVGHYVTYNNGAKPETQYSYKDSTGTTRWSSADAGSPFATGVKSEIDSKGDMYLTSPAPAQGTLLEQAQRIDALRGTHLADAMTKGKPLGSSGSFEPDTVTSGDVSDTFTDASGAKVTVSLKNGQFSADSTVTTNGHEIKQSYDISALAGATGQSGFSLWKPADAIAPSRLVAGALPGITYSTALATSLDSAGGSQNGVAASLINTPEFQHTFLSQEMQKYGTSNALDPRIVDDWKGATSPKLGPPAPSALVRDDLAYPGQKSDPNAGLQGSVGITFGGQSIKLPNLPSYLGQSSVDLSGAANAAKPALDLFRSYMGLGDPTMSGPAAKDASPLTPQPTPPMPPINTSQNTNIPQPGAIAAPAAPLGGSTPAPITSKPRAL